MTFITIEGPGGVGKSTLITGLKAKYPEAVFVHEPGGTEISRKAYELLTSEPNVAPITRWLLFCVGIAQTYAEVVKPALDSGKMVFADRWTGSTYVYQGLIYRAVDANLIDNVGADITGYKRPDLTIILTAKPLTIYLRRVGRKDSDADEKRTAEQVSAYESYFRLLAYRFRKAFLINTDQDTPEQTLIRAIQAIENAVKFG